MPGAGVRLLFHTVQPPQAVNNIFLKPRKALYADTRYMDVLI